MMKNFKDLHLQQVHLLATAHFSVRLPSPPSVKIKEKGFYLFMIKCQIMRRLIQSSIDLIDSNIVDVSTIIRGC